MARLKSGVGVSADTLYLSPDASSAPEQGLMERVWHQPKKTRNFGRKRPSSTLGWLARCALIGAAAICQRVVGQSTLDSLAEDQTSAYFTRYDQDGVPYEVTNYQPDYWTFQDKCETGVDYLNSQGSDTLPTNHMVVDIKSGSDVSSKWEWGETEVTVGSFFILFDNENLDSNGKYLTGIELQIEDGAGEIRQEWSGNIGSGFYDLANPFVSTAAQIRIINTSPDTQTIRIAAIHIFGTRNVFPLSTFSTGLEGETWTDFIRGAVPSTAHGRRSYQKYSLTEDADCSVYLKGTAKVTMDLGDLFKVTDLLVVAESSPDSTLNWVKAYDSINGNCDSPSNNYLQGLSIQTHDGVEVDETGAKIYQTVPGSPIDQVESGGSFVQTVIVGKNYQDVGNVREIVFQGNDENNSEVKRLFFIGVFGERVCYNDVTLCTACAERSSECSTCVDNAVSTGTLCACTDGYTENEDGSACVEQGDSAVVAPTAPGSSCPSGEFDNGDACEVCPDGCLTCTSADQCTVCTSGEGPWEGICCEEGAFYWDEECISTLCEEAHYFDQEQGECIECSAGCASCFGEVCETCLDGYELYNDECHDMEDILEYVVDEEFLDEIDLEDIEIEAIEDLFESGDFEFPSEFDDEFFDEFGFEERPFYEEFFDEDEFIRDELFDGDEGMLAALIQDGMLDQDFDLTDIENLDLDDLEEKSGDKELVKKVFASKAKSKFKFDADNFQSMGVPVFKPSFMEKSSESTSTKKVKKKKTIVPQISEISQTGIIQIKFDPPEAIVPDKWDKYFDKSLRSNATEAQRAEAQKQEQNLFQVIFDQNSEEKEIGYSIQLDDFSAAGLQVSIKFDNPLLVSQGDESDFVKVRLLKDFFTNNVKNAQSDARRRSRMLSDIDPADMYHEFKAEVPKQVKSEQELEQLTSTVESAKNFMFGQFAVSFVVNLLLSGTLSQLWNIFNTLQLITALPLFAINTPGNVISMNTKFSEVANFKIVEKQQLYDWIIVPIFGTSSSQEKLVEENVIAAPTEVESDSSAADMDALLEPLSVDDEDEAVEESYLNVFFQGSNLLMNVLLLVLVFLLLACTIVCIVKCRRLVQTKCCNCAKNVLRKVESKIMFNSVLRAVLEAYFTFSISTFFQLRSASFEDSEKTVNTLMAIGFVLALILFPALQHKFLVKKQDQLEKEEFTDKYGSLYQNVNPSKVINLRFTLYFCLRRLAFAFVINFFFKSVVLQMLVADFAVLGMLAFYIPNRPMSGYANNFVQIFNELIIMLFIISLVVYTDFIPNPEDRYELGYVFLYTIGFNIAVNLIVLIFTIVRKIYKGCRSFFLKRAKQKQINEMAKKKQASTASGEKKVDLEDDKRVPRRDAIALESISEKDGESRSDYDDEDEEADESPSSEYEESERNFNQRAKTQSDALGKKRAALSGVPSSSSQVRSRPNITIIDKAPMQAPKKSTALIYGAVETHVNQVDIRRRTPQVTMVESQMDVTRNNENSIDARFDSIMQQFEDVFNEAREQNPSPPSQAANRNREDDDQDVFQPMRRQARQQNSSSNNLSQQHRHRRASLRSSDHLSSYGHN